MGYIPSGDSVFSELIRGDDPELVVDPDVVADPLPPVSQDCTGPRASTFPFPEPQHTTADLVLPTPFPPIGWNLQMIQYPRKLLGRLRVP